MLVAHIFLRDKHHNFKTEQNKVKQSAKAC